MLQKYLTTTCDISGSWLGAFTTNQRKGKRRNENGKLEMGILKGVHGELLFMETTDLVAGKTEKQINDIISCILRMVY